MGNNGIWALEKHPMEFLYGYSVAAELRPGTRYDQVVEALGGHGELVERPGDLKPALERAFSAGRPALVNVLTDPTSSIPADRTWRRADLADAALAARVLAVQHAAYAIEAELIGYPDLPPLHETLAALQATEEELLAVRGGRRPGRGRRPGARRGRDGHRAALRGARRASGAGWARRSSRTRWRRPRGAACASARARATRRRSPCTSASGSAGSTRARRRRAAATSSSCASPETMEAARGRLPKLAPTGRAGVRAMKGPFDGPSGGRRRFDAASPEPMRPTAGDPRHDGTNTPSPALRLSAVGPSRRHHTYVQLGQQKW